MSIGLAKWAAIPNLTHSANAKGGTDGPHVWQYSKITPFQFFAKQVVSADETNYYKLVSKDKWELPTEKVKKMREQSMTNEQKKDEEDKEDEKEEEEEHEGEDEQGEE